MNPWDVLAMAGGDPPEMGTTSATTETSTQPATTARKIIKDSIGSEMVVEPRASVWSAFILSVRSFFKAFEVPLGRAAATWKLARKTTLPYHARVAPVDPLIESHGFEESSLLPDDAPSVELFKDDRGAYFTEEMLKRGKYIPAGRVTFAVEISVAQAERLMGRFETILQDADLTDNDRVLYEACKRVVQAQYAGEVDYDGQLL